jgi:hypothetical protein
MGRKKISIERVTGTKQRQVNLSSSLRCSLLIDAFTDVLCKKEAGLAQESYGDCRVDRCQGRHEHH